VRATQGVVGGGEVGLGIQVVGGALHGSRAGGGVLILRSKGVVGRCDVGFGVRLEWSAVSIHFSDMMNSS